MTDQQPEPPRRPEEAAPRAGEQQGAQQPPEPPPWPTLGSNWRDVPEPPPAPPPNWESAPWGQAADQQARWQPPPAYQAGPPPPAPYHAYGQPPAPYYHPGGYPRARIPDSSARNWAMFAHLSPFLASFIGLPFLGPLVIWLAKRDEHPYVAEQAREALNFNLSMFIYMIAATFLMLLFIGFLIVPVLGIVWLVLMVMAAVKASNGEAYRYPMTMRMVN